MKKIPNSIVEEAAFIKDCQEKGLQFCVMKNRKVGQSYVNQLVSNTINVEHEEVEQLKLGTNDK